MEKIQITLRNLPVHKHQYEDEDEEMNDDDGNFSIDLFCCYEKKENN
jgi:hypothetical protein